jgi:hypothetical protein
MQSACSVGANFVPCPPPPFKNCQRCLTDGADGGDDEENEDAQVDVPVQGLLDEQGPGVQINL